jgi:hypothetical protein
VKCGHLLTPRYDLMHRRLPQSFAIHADERPRCSCSRDGPLRLVYCGDVQNPYTRFDLTAG